MDSQNNADATSVEPIVMRLRDPSFTDIDEAAAMLEFFFGQMQMHSADMGGQHSYRFRSSGWPMTHCKGPSAEDAVRAAMQEIMRNNGSHHHVSERKHL